MRRALTKGEYIANKCKDCEHCKKMSCRFNKCPFFVYIPPVRKKITLPRYVYVEPPKPKRIDKKLLFMLFDSGLSMVEIADRLKVRPQKVVDIIEERRKKG